MQEIRGEKEEMNQLGAVSFGKQQTLLVKGAASILLLIHHVMLDSVKCGSLRIHSYLVPDELLYVIGHFSKVCVGMFAFLSGFGMCMSLKGLSTELSLSIRQWIWYVSRRYILFMTNYLWTFILMNALSYWFDADYRYRYGNDFQLLWVLHFFLDMTGFSAVFSSPTLIPTWWYVGFATVFIVLFPSIICTYMRGGSVLVLFAAVILYRIRVNITFTYPLFSALVGMILADKGIMLTIVRFKCVNNTILDRLCKLLLYGTLVVIIVFLREYTVLGELHEFSSGICSVVMIIFFVSVLDGVPVLSHALLFIGKHSQTLFLSHSFFSGRFLYYPIYHLTNIVLVVAVLLLVCIITGLVIEILQKVVCYNTLLARLLDRMERWRDKQ